MWGRKPLLWIVFGALALRIAAALVLRDRLDIHGDAEGYWELGRRMAHGESYQLYDPPRKVMRMPGFPLFIAGAIRLSEGLQIPQQAPIVARLALAVVGGMTCWLVGVLGKQLFNERVGLLAAALSALAPPLIGFSIILLSETLFAATLVASLVALARLVHAEEIPTPFGRSVVIAVLAGAAISAAVYVRPSRLLFGPFFAIGLVVFPGTNRVLWRRLVLGGLVVITSYAALLPWAFRNQRVTGHRVVTTLWVGPSLYDGFHTQATGDSDLRFFEDERPMDRMSEYEMDQHYRSRAWQFICENPSRAAQLTLKKIVRYWSPVPNAQQFKGASQEILTAAYFVPVVLASMIAVWIGPRSFWVWGLTIGPILYFAAIHSVFLGSLRYRLPAEYPLCVAASSGVWHLYRRFRREHA